MAEVLQRPRDVVSAGERDGAVVELVPRGRVPLPGVLVYLVAQMDDVVHIVVRDVAVRRVEPLLEGLAGHDGQPDAVGTRVGRREGPTTADPTGRPRVVEPVVEVAVRREFAVHVHLDDVVVGGGDPVVADPPLVDDVRERLVLGDLYVHRSLVVVGVARHLGPEDDPAGGRAAAGDRQGVGRLRVAIGGPVHRVVVHGFRANPVDDVRIEHRER